MKNYIRKIVGLAIMALSLAACTDDLTNPVDDPSVLNLGSMKATVNDESFYSQSAEANKNGEFLSITASQLVNNSQGRELINLALIDPDVGDNTATGYFSYTPNINKPAEMTSWTSNEISVEITSMTSTEIQGRFSFTGTNGGDIKNIRSGVFRARID